MDATKIEAALQEIVEKKTLSLDGIGAVEELRRRVAGYEARDAQAKADAEKRAQHELVTERDDLRGIVNGYEAKNSALDAKADALRQREQAIALTEARLEERGKALNDVLTFASLVFKNRMVRESAFTSQSIPLSQDGYQTTTASGSENKTREVVEE